MASSVQTRRAIPRLHNSESLAAIVSQTGPLPEEQVWNVIDQLLARLESLHEAGKCHRCISMSTIGIDAAGELEIATTDAALSVSDLIRLHSPLPTSLRHEFELVISSNAHDASIALAHAGFEGDGVSLDLYQVAVLIVRMVFDVDSEKFLSSPCLQENLSPELCNMMRQLLAAKKQDTSQTRALRQLLPGAGIESADLLMPPNQSVAEVSSSSLTLVSATDVPFVAESALPPPTSESAQGDLPATTMPKELAAIRQPVSKQVNESEISDSLPAYRKAPIQNRSLIWIGGAILVAVAILTSCVMIWFANH